MGRRPSNENAFAKLLYEESGPLYWITPDRTIRYINESLSQWLGIAREKIEDRRADYHSAPTGDPSRDAANQLCPPAEVFAQKTDHFEVQLARAGESHRSPWCARATRVRSSQGADLGLVIQLTPEPDGRPNQTGAISDLHERVAALRGELYAQTSVERFLGVSPAAALMRKQIAAAAANEAATLIIGPPGSGRETIARTIHTASGTSKRLLPISCRHLDAEMLKSLMDSSAFRRKSDAAAAPVLLLLEIDLLDKAAQETLREVFREPFPPRVLSTARTSLKTLVSERKFDAKLCDHLAEIQIESPSLISRREDIPILAQAFLEQHNVGRESQFSQFTAEALDLLVCYSWPENIDQLFDVVRQSVDASEGPAIDAPQLPERIRAARHAAEHPRESATAPVDLDAIRQQVERELITKALELARGNKSKAAQLLSLPRSRLLRKMEQLQMSPTRAPGDAEELPDFRPLSDFPELSESAIHESTSPEAPVSESAVSKPPKGDVRRPSV